MSADTDTANCSTLGIDACGNIVKASSGTIASGVPLVLQGLLFAVAALILVIILKSQYNTWAKDSDYTVSDLLWNGTRAICIFLMVIMFTAL